MALSENEKKTIQTYDLIAQEYHQTYKDGFSRQETALKTFESYVKKGVILDVGCGSGHFAKYFSQKGFFVIGIDLSKEMIAIAKEFAPKATFYVQDMKLTSFEKNYFDGIFASASFLHVEYDDANAVLSHWNQLLKPKGYVYISTQQGKQKERTDKEFKKNHFRQFFDYTPESLTRILEKNGFDVLKAKTNSKGKWVDAFAQKK